MSALATALVEAQKELPAVPKNATANTGAFSYSYVTLDSLISKTLPVLNKHGLAITQAPEHIEGYGLGLRTTLLHVDGETLTSVMPLVAGHSSQDAGGAITYARRYMWASLLGIASEHDDDAQTSSAAAPRHAAVPSSPAAASLDGVAADPHGLQQSRGDASGPLATEAQKKLVRMLEKKLNVEPKTSVDSLTKAAASQHITELKALEEGGLISAPGGADLMADIPFAPVIA